MELHAFLDQRRHQSFGCGVGARHRCEVITDQPELVSILSWILTAVAPAHEFGELLDDCGALHDVDGKVHVQFHILGITA